MPMIQTIPAFPTGPFKICLFTEPVINGQDTMNYRSCHLLKLEYNSFLAF